VFRLLLKPNSKKGISVPVSTYATTPREDTRWAVVIPFAVGKSGVNIDSLLPEPVNTIFI
jgi:hypothetical protein